MPPFGTVFGNLGTGMLSSAGSSFGSSAGSGLGDALFGGIKAKRQWKYEQKAMKLQQRYVLEQMAKSAEYQLAHDKEMFDYENTYNEPSKVFDRYLKAGVTPAAVLGSSGVGINATVPAGSGGAPSGSSPSGGSPNPGGVTPMPSDPLMIAQIGVAKSTEDRNNADASLSRAQAKEVSNRTMSPDDYKTIFDANTRAVIAGITNTKALADLNKALSDIARADADVANTLVGYKIQDFIAQAAVHKEQYDQIRRYNDQYFDPVMEATILLDRARAFEASASANLSVADTKLANIRYVDAANWLQLNWDEEFDIPVRNEKGQVTHTKRVTGREMAKAIMTLDFDERELTTYTQRWELRNEKNRPGYDMLRYFSGAVGAAAGAAMTRAAAGPVRTSEVSTEHYDQNGEFIGGSMVRRRDMRGRSRK